MFDILNCSFHFHLLIAIPGICRKAVVLHQMTDEAFEKGQVFLKLKKVQLPKSASVSRCPFGYYHLTDTASYGDIFAAKWSSNVGLEAVVVSK